uniref:Uncharacterized protein n=1 Tax=Chromera velia CCMP2878 TaxID=1169474 RepID=A0A0G4FIV2_9ALVE|mmetsp:Transcript_54524/g.106661  ORF Transcript_54524/g.106661 Transcript_54524/m.106661 type:complete len:107 (+) Transcript_54524:316-636(+)|eukprot:Cvel_17276.t1-p1 / transcript=Cvel_17276.t1 / gene=Cvel_17276 / organism=Chromera_velia_CCMP2878 / gene_product=hypothetical protein / transcript_product=hypothetical protein / location=Cvel_scaffold1370:19559-22553(-) / protein_length=106 / sequence_SO=supercontig / SO=protein_coding / is_pseudo=false
MSLLRLSRALRSSAAAGAASSAGSKEAAMLKVGTSVLAVAAIPFVYSYLKSAYWHRRFNKLAKNEILSERFQWLNERMLDDEVDKVLISQGTSTDPSKPGLLLGQA